MKVTNPLDRILDNEVKIRILRFLCKTGAKWNGRQIAKEVGMSPATAHKALQALNAEGILLLQNIGKTHLYELNEDNYLVRNLLKPLFGKEDKIYDNIFTVIKSKVMHSSLKKDIVSIALFGSVNALADHARSDIDLAVVVKNAQAKPKVEELFEVIDESVSTDFGNTVSPYLNTIQEFKSRYRDGLQPIKSILQSYRLIYGKRVEDLI